MIKKKVGVPKAFTDRCERASLTVEAALIMPIFFYFMIAFLYFIQIFTLQEQIQVTITKMGLNLSKTAYVYKDFHTTEDAINFDQTIFGTEFDIGLNELISSNKNESLLKLYAMKYIDMERINRSCIQDGFDGISFFSSRLLDEDNCIDIVVRYRVRIPINLFALDELHMIQRVRLRSWTGFEVAPTYSMEENHDKKKEIAVYITETGSVYHKNKECSHIKLSVRSVIGIPQGLRNDSGAKYYPCEGCCTGMEGYLDTYYITTFGTRYHTSNKCSKIKRNIKEIPLSEIGSRLPCKRCGN